MHAYAVEGTIFVQTKEVRAAHGFAINANEIIQRLIDLKVKHPL